MNDTEWLGLSEAAKLLGVHPATVRNWADRGLLASQRTPGGHRRFRRSDLVHWIDGQVTPPASEAQFLIHNAMGRARMEIGDGQITETSWYQQISDSTRAIMRQQGRRLMEMLGLYVISGSANALAEARKLGLEYGKQLHENGLTCAQCMEGFFTFNDMLVESMLHLSEVREIRPTSEQERFQRIYSFTREIVLALVDEYEA